MSDPLPQMDLLYTKLHAPPVSEKQVVRLHLLERLDVSLHQRLTLVCAPAGYGKTTLLSQWVNRRAEPVGWVSLDCDDNDLARFLHYFLTALQRIEPTVGAQIPDMMQVIQPLHGAAVLMPFINDVAAAEKEFLVILDDYQEVEERSIHRALDYLIEHMPENLHLILATRADPPIALPRLRARGYLTELRLSDLRFSAQEVEEFLNIVKGFNLTLDDVTALENKTEGWIASLQMAALSLQGRCQDPASQSEFVREFTGSHRFILDYLVEEVLKHQSPELQEFLLKTSILKRLCGSLCNAVTERTDGQNVLEHLEATNLFIIPLDDERRWYRYHHLFSDLLHKHLLRTFPEHVTDLHRRARSWHEKQGLMDEAIHHALASQDFESAAALIEESVEATFMRSQVMNFLNWMEMLPNELVRSHPNLRFFRAWALLMSGQSPEVIEHHLQDVLVAQDEAENTGSMAGRISILRAYILAFQADIQHAAALCRQAVGHLPENDLFLHSVAAWILSLERLQNDDLQSGILALDEVARLSQDMGNTLISVGVLCDQAKLHKRQGHLQQAKGVLARALQLATGPQGQRLPVASKALIELGDIQREWNRLEEAEADLAESIELSRQWSEMAAFYAYLPLVRIHMAQGDMQAASQAIETACRIARESEATQLDDLVAGLQQAIFFIRQGDIAAAMRWAQRRGLVPGVSVKPCSVLDESQDYVSTHLRKYEQIVLARLFILQGQADEALDLLEAVLKQCRELGRIDLTIEVQILRAQAFQISGHSTQAVEALSQALSLAEPGGYVRIFLDEGQPVIRLIRQAASRGIAPAYTAKLLAASGPPEAMEKIAEYGSSHAQTLIEPLSKRELDVLRLLAAGISNREIADELVVAASTVHSHCKSIYSKLDVHSRSSAALRARELGLI
jgi:LuxR family maltose regulon positive regulatory protein